MPSNEPTERPRGDVKMAECDNCGRSFAEDRLDTHFNICVNQKERKPFNVAKQRIVGTEAEDMLKTGRLKLSKPKPEMSKSELTKKTLTKEPLPPIQSKGQKTAKSDNTAYRIDFEGDEVKTHKHSKYGPTPRAAATARIMSKQHNGTPPPQMADDSSGGCESEALATMYGESAEKYLSAQRAQRRWNSAAIQANPRIARTLDEMDSDEADFLASSHASQASDAFDFLFDSQNLNPEKVYSEEKVQEQIKRQEEDNAAHNKTGDKNVVQNSACCVIS